MLGEPHMPIEILLVEDNRGDVRLAQEAFAQNKLINVHVAGDGLEAMAFLKKEGIYAHAPRPDMIMLDLDLPNMNGRDFLRLIKADESLESISVFIVTGSPAEADVAKSYQNGAKGYNRKPVQWHEFESLVDSVYNFWMPKGKLLS
jgi:two-component system, chemotaxis family, response regulator Rcp1